ncbi:MAG TPA: permease prefix domain 1-containing protein [Candidatus Thermoplasmatota archaeon]
MTNARLEEYLRSVDANLAHIPREEREATLLEMRSHLHDQVTELRRADAEMGEVEATERAIRAFGDPSDIGVSYGNGGTNHVVVNNRTGEVVLRVVRATGRVAAATGRGIGRTLKWILFAIFAILFLAIGSALTLLIVFQDDLREAAPRPIHSYSRHLDDADGERNSTFVVGPDVKEIRIHLGIYREGVVGCAAITIRDPNNIVVFDSTGDCDDLETLLTFYQEGRWTISYEYQDFNGHLEVDVYAFERAD